MDPVLLKLGGENLKTTKPLALNLGLLWDVMPRGSKLSFAAHTLVFAPGSVDVWYGVKHIYSFVQSLGIHPNFL